MDCLLLIKLALSGLSLFISGKFVMLDMKRKKKPWKKKHGTGGQTRSASQRSHCWFIKYVFRCAWCQAAFWVNTMWLIRDGWLFREGSTEQGDPGGRLPGQWLARPPSGSCLDLVVTWGKDESKGFIPSDPTAGVTRPCLHHAAEGRPCWGTSVHSSFFLSLVILFLPGLIGPRDGKATLL